jgi:hypothetical protein
MMKVSMETKDGQTERRTQRKIDRYRKHRKSYGQIDRLTADRCKERKMLNTQNDRKTDGQT